MGGQQFARDAILLDMRKMNRVLNFDSDNGTVEVEAGIQWPELIVDVVKRQEGKPQQWGIAQKQTGADRLSIGGALAANVHGRGLRMKPIIADVESFELVNAQGERMTCSLNENADLFRLVIGGYGLFGVVASVRLRLVPRQKLERVVEIRSLEGLMTAVDGRVRDGFLYGDFQFSINEKSGDFLRRGVFSCYRPVDPAMPIPADEKQLSEEDWKSLLFLAHADKEQAYQKYADYYLSTSGQVYWSDVHQLSIYPDNYHRELDRKLGTKHRATEMITELYVPREALPDFMKEAAEDFRKNRVNVIYGTVRLIEPDEESFLAWAKQRYACIVFNLHTVHTRQGLEHSAAAFRRLIALAIRLEGSYYLTYHRWATRQQVEACYPQFSEFLRVKKKYDPAEVFQSEWYRHYKRMFADAL